jgi:hypothetical protein
MRHRKLKPLVHSAEAAISSTPSVPEETDMPYEPLDLSFLMTPKMEAAIEEMKDLIASGFPGATFEVGYGEEPVGVYLRATVDREDMGEVVDHFIDRLVDLQIDEGLRLYVVPVRPAARSREMRRREQERANVLKAVS